MAGCATCRNAGVAELASRKLGGIHYGAESHVAGLASHRSIRYVLRNTGWRLDHDATRVVFGRVSGIVALRAVRRGGRGVGVDVHQGWHLREVGITGNQIDIGMALITCCR